MNKEHQRIANNINLTYGVDSIQKSGGGGTGSRGGHVIGTTQSGKPIYESAHESHKSFSKQDHLDAVKEHDKRTQVDHTDYDKEINQSKVNQKIKKHRQAREYHQGEADLFYERDSNINKSTYTFSKSEIEVFDTLMKSSTEEQNTTVKRVLDEWKEGRLENSTGDIITSGREALKIALSEIGLEKSFNDELEKSHAAQIGEIHEWDGKKYKKQPNGKWMEVSEKGFTKNEHLNFKEKHENKHEYYKEDQDFHQEQYVKHQDIADKLSDKEHSDEEVGINVDDHSGKEKPIEFSERKIKQRHSDKHLTIVEQPDGIREYYHKKEKVATNDNGKVTYHDEEDKPKSEEQK